MIKKNLLSALLLLTLINNNAILPANLGDQVVPEAAALAAAPIASVVAAAPIASALAAAPVIIPLVPIIPAAVAPMDVAPMDDVNPASFTSPIASAAAPMPGAPRANRSGSRLNASSRVPLSPSFCSTSNLPESPLAKQSSFHPDSFISPLASAAPPMPGAPRANRSGGRYHLQLLALNFDNDEAAPNEEAAAWDFAPLVDLGNQAFGNPDSFTSPIAATAPLTPSAPRANGFKRLRLDITPVRLDFSAAAAPAPADPMLYAPTTPSSTEPQSPAPTTPNSATYEYMSDAENVPGSDYSQSPNSITREDIDPENTDDDLDSPQ